MGLLSLSHTLDPYVQNAHFSHITVSYIIIGLNLFASTRITLLLGLGLHNIKIL